MDIDCHYGDHTWRGTSQCVRCGARLRCWCGARLRCWCGVYVREDNMDDHVGRCPHFERLAHEERDTLNEALRAEAMRGVAANA